MGLYVRSIKNDQLKDSLLELDPYLFLRWINLIVETGKIPTVDYMRAYPIGFATDQESLIMPYTVAYLYKILHFLNPQITVVNSASWYPLFAFGLSLIPFYLLLKEILGKKTAILGSFFLSIIPGFLFRTFQSYADKEPLALLTMYLAMYLFIKAWYSVNDKKPWAATLPAQVFWSVMAGVWAGIMSLTWGGTAILFIAGGGFALLSFILWFKAKDVLTYFLWLVFYVIVSLTFTMKYGGWMYGFQVLLSNVGSLLAIGTLGLGIGCLVIRFIETKSAFVKNIKLPLGAKSIVLIGSLGLVLMLVTGQLGPMTSKVLEQFVHPFERARHTLTVAENRQPYFSDWAGEFGFLFMWIAFAGAVLLFWDMMVDMRHNKSNQRWLIVGLFVFMLAGILFSRNSPTGLMNGETGASVIFFMGSLALFFGVLVLGYIRAYYKDKDLFEIISTMDKASIKPWFVIFFLIECMIAARGAARLFTILAPAMAIVGGYFFVSLWSKLQGRVYKIIIAGVFVFIGGTMLMSTLALARSMGPTITPNWIETTTWIKENTPKDAVFAHWWDYGYWVQTLGERATVLDGGQPMAPWNYLLGRYVLTGQNFSEALNFLYAHNVSYFLIDPTDIGKYPAYASIGSDKNYDRLSYVTSFALQPQVGGKKEYVYAGQYGFDEDYIATTGKTYPKGGAGVTQVMMDISRPTNETVSVTNARVRVVGPAGQIDEPLQCVNVYKQEFVFNVTGYEGCLVVLPEVDPAAQTIKDFGGAIFLSRRGRAALWTQIYLRGYDKDSPFERVFDSQPQALVYVKDQGPWGPITVWKVHYPENMTVDPAMLSTEFPAGTFME